MAVGFIRKVAVASAVVATVGGMSSGTSAFAAAPHHAAAPAASKVVSSVIGEGVTDGTAWSVTLEYYPALPKGYVPQAGNTDPSLLCQRVVIGGVRVDRRAGPWSDCDDLSGAHDPAAGGEEGLWGNEGKGTSGVRLFVADPTADVAEGVVNLTDGSALTARCVQVPGTGYRAWAVAIAPGETIATVDQYDARGDSVSHETLWR